MSMTSTSSSPRALWSRAWAISPALTLGTVVMLLGALFTLAGLVFDPRRLLGEPLWLKPAKFYVSLAIYDATLLYFLSVIPGRQRFVRAVGAILSVCGALEMVAITLQAARGVRSHFNVATTFDNVIFAGMGITITVLWLAMMVLAVVMLRTKLGERTLASALRMGLVVGILGAGLAYFMTSPRPEQLASLKAGEVPVEVGSHTFGGKDGGPGLSLVGWSTTAGDMRPAHFFGLHGMQVLPFVAVVLARRRSLSESLRLALVRAAGVAYFGLTVVLALQALRGLPIVRWDAAGVASLVLVAVASLATFAVSFGRKKQALTVVAA
ncbi:hypothetical protein [Vitiosangium sp. GDMCC 1.1324]|uniref:hypothetical protein n=1 Tax=Vitiosangium sp. (strain GDMCC 1.1324) TaxID=2138576 RepID=UPI000D3C0A29|nr:hypothetical protein [Vitiosangium sp. GDMCC 1.1324]PTL81622.1 hypothetical protein DAT35_21970 [Vitiosangium sp. GDMCC 1.1324]